MRLGRFLADGISTVHVLTACIPHFPRQLHLKVLPVRSDECRARERRGLAGIEETGNAVLPVWASRGKFGQIWSVLSIMSRWKGPDQITNFELITKVVAGLCFIPSPTLLSFSLWWFLPPSVFLKGALPSPPCTTLDVLLILFHLITPCLGVREH